MNKRGIFIAVLIFVLLFCSCSYRNTATADELIGRLLAVCGEDYTDNGYMYFLGAEQGEVGYFSEENKVSLYGRRAYEHSFDKIESCAVYVSARTPSELAVFRCYSSSDTRDIALMCRDRVDMLKVALRGTEYEEKINAARIVEHGRYVVYAFVENPNKAIERFYKLI